MRSLALADRPHADPAPTPALRVVAKTAGVARAHTPGWGNQEEAAAHLGISVALFRRDVTVLPCPVGPPRPGKRPLLRWRYADLDDWMYANRDYKLPAR